MNEDKILLWLEDRQETIETQIKLAEGASFKFKVRLESKPMKVEEFLAEAKAAMEIRAAASSVEQTSAGPDDGPPLDLLQAKRMPVGLVIDVMLAGVTTINNLDGDEYGADGGYEAGWMFIDKFLRAKDSPYQDIPICVLSARDIDNEHQGLLKKLRERGGASITTIEKYAVHWTKKFENWLKEIDARGGKR